MTTAKSTTTATINDFAEYGALLRELSALNNFFFETAGIIERENFEEDGGIDCSTNFYKRQLCQVVKQASYKQAEILERIEKLTDHKPEVSGNVSPVLHMPEHNIKFSNRGRQNGGMVG